MAIVNAKKRSFNSKDGEEQSTFFCFLPSSLTRVLEDASEHSISISDLVHLNGIKDVKVPLVGKNCCFCILIIPSLSYDFAIPYVLPFSHLHAKTKKLSRYLCYCKMLCHLS